MQFHQTAVHFLDGLQRICSPQHLIHFLLHNRVIVASLGEPLPAVGSVSPSALKHFFGNLIHRLLRLSFEDLIDPFLDGCVIQSQCLNGRLPVAAVAVPAGNDALGNFLHGDLRAACSLRIPQDAIPWIIVVAAYPEFTPSLISRDTANSTSLFIDRCLHQRVITAEHRGMVDRIQEHVTPDQSSACCQIYLARHVLKSAGKEGWPHISSVRCSPALHRHTSRLPCGDNIIKTL